MICLFNQEAAKKADYLTFHLDWIEFMGFTLFTEFRRTPRGGGANYSYQLSEYFVGELGPYRLDNEYFKPHILLPLEAWL